MFTDCIVTDRLILRHFVEEDVDDVFALMSDDYICRMAGIPPFKTPERARWFMDNWQDGAYAITERDGDDTVIGIIQVPYHWFEGRVSFGYWLAEPYRGKGYMTEVVEALTENVFNSYLYCDEIDIFVYRGNEASRNVALKCGFFPKYEAYKECVYSHYGVAESEECYAMTRGDYEWRRRGESSYSTAA